MGKYVKSYIKYFLLFYVLLFIMFWQIKLFELVTSEELVEIGFGLLITVIITIIANYQIVNGRFKIGGKQNKYQLKRKNKM